MYQLFDPAKGEYLLLKTDGRAIVHITGYTKDPQEAYNFNSHAGANVARSIVEQCYYDNQCKLEIH